MTLINELSLLFHSYIFVNIVVFLSLYDQGEGILIIY